ncbi:patatin-like phospholipase family protein [Oceanimonas marisflavi]|uniref:patatin-like phospholipase family protein n=1 Tax=Oceanimonas marisflavi TaxID=2059724 RepID=UPI001E477A08|nr:patatin-like phospholipase family protein [Oceanimonas marisflavi]
MSGLLSDNQAGQGRLALICEGGGQRGIFTAGVLDAFMAADFDPFDLFIGSSAGAQNLSAYVCHSRGFAREVITDYTTRSDFFRPLHFARGGDLVDLDWYFEVLRHELPLDVVTGHRRLGARELLFCSTRARDHLPHYFHPADTDWLLGLKASSAIPLLYRAGVEWQGERYLDGGVADAIPVREAWRRGARVLVVIRTQPGDMRFSLSWARRLEGWLGRDRLGELLAIVRAYQRCCDDAHRFMTRPPDRARVFEIAPPAPLHSRVLGSTRAQLDRDYQLGFSCGQHFLHQHGPLLERLGRQ